MKSILIILFFTSTLLSMQRPIGQLISDGDWQQAQNITRDTHLDLKEIVAVNTQGKWRYGWVQSTPDPSTGIWLGIVNWVSQVGDTYGGQAKNFGHAVKKLPRLDHSKVSKTV